MLASIASVPFAAADDHGLKQKKTHALKHQKNQVQNRINGANHDLDESSAQLRQATAQLQHAQAQLTAARAHLAKTQGELAAAEALDQEMQAKLDAAVRRLHQARADLTKGRKKVVHQQDDLGRIVVQNYQAGDPSLMGLSMVLTSQDPAQLSGQLNSVQNVIDKESVVLDRLQATKALLIVQENQVAKAKQQVAVQRKAAAENLVRKRELKQQAEDAEANVANLVSLRADAEQEAEKAKAADLATLRSLQQERTRISGILERRAEAARRRAAAAARRAGSSIGDSGPTRSNGFLDYPVNAPVTSPFGWRIHPIYGYRSLHDGIDFGAGCGTPIRAAAAGKVISEYYQTAWGNRIIIDHGFHRGVGLATISNHLSGYAVHTGQHVRRGQIVGYVGTTGWSTGCHLHFTVMQNGTPVNPQNWF
ncbi:MAG: peptidoglycan DD-metalloendopeptidase family protein [Nocardioidaceae bacterium]|nr:peptidoglycan DD-metalloendopeptidase family protein [Nocardioidaceae bacterium]NUS52162.1 peptidoglycan DD-metalloendopeptidase family protein [Nocardioidaceae bacterium]